MCDGPQRGYFVAPDGQQVEIVKEQKGLAGERDEFLFSHHPPFREAFVSGYERLLKGPPAADYERQVARDIAPYNTAGLCDPAKNNMYPYA